MKAMLFAAACAVLAFPAGSYAQMGDMKMPPPPPPSTGPASEVLRTYSGLKPNVIKAAEKMPEADYQYKPLPDIRPYARVINHVTETQFRLCGALNGTAFDKTKVPADTADKATIVAALKASFDECDKAYNGMTEAGATEIIAMGPTKRSRIGIAWGNVSHDNEQYAELAMYLRMKGLTPPTAAEK